MLRLQIRVETSAIIGSRIGSDVLHLQDACLQLLLHDQICAMELVLRSRIHVETPAIIGLRVGLGVLRL